MKLISPILLLNFLFFSCKSDDELYFYSINNKCIEKHIAEFHVDKSVVPYIQILSKSDGCKEYYISGVIYLSAMKYHPPCYYSHINKRLVAIYTEDCFVKDKKARSLFFINKMKPILNDDITVKPKRYIDGYEIIELRDFYDPLQAKIKECDNKSCKWTYVKKMPL